MAFIDAFGRAHTKRSQPALKSLATRLSLWKSRRDLAQLDARLLADIGVSPVDAEREAQLGVWDVPPTWLDR